MSFANVIDCHGFDINGLKWPIWWYIMLTHLWSMYGCFLYYSVIIIHACISYKYQSIVHEFSIIKTA